MAAITALFAALIIMWREIPGASYTAADIPLPLFLIGISTLGTFTGAKAAYGVSEKKVYYLVGAVVILASIVITAQKYMLQE